MSVLLMLGKLFLVFGIGYFLVHQMKKHSMATSTPIDFLMTVVLGNILAQPIVSNRPGMTVLYAVIFVLMQIIASKLILWRPFRRILAFTPTILVNKGRIDEAALVRERVSIPHLLAELRVKGYSNVADVEYAILEETGGISVIPKAEKRPLQPADLGMRLPYEGLPATVILDGKIADAGLRFLGKDREWLMSLLNSYGIHADSLGQISLAALDSLGKLHVDYFSDNPKPET